MIDWKKEANFGPEKKRISETEVKEIAEEIGLKMDRKFDAGLYHWALILVK